MPIGTPLALSHGMKKMMPALMLAALVGASAPVFRG